MEELVELYGEDGSVIGTAPRSRMRAARLRHGRTAILVRNDKGKVLLHRRTDSKDLFPGLYDFVVGGVLMAGESPQQGAERELGEELGVSDVEVVPLAQADYEDEHTRYRAFLYTAHWDGPVRPQTEEVAWCCWMKLADLRKALVSPEWDFVPDSPVLWKDYLEEGLIPPLPG
jgi:isopentenyldiphosphate isomerase